MVLFLVVQSMRAFAAEAGVKPATLLRLAQRLGYNGWRELKSAFIDDLGLGNDTYVSKAEKLIAKGTQPALYEEVFLAHQANLAFTQAENQHAMQQAVRLLDEAKQVYICGFRASFPIAWSLFYVYRLFNRQVSLIDGLASNIEVFTREINAEDCLLLTSFSPYSRESLDVLNAARQAGARIIAITDSPVSPAGVSSTAVSHTRRARFAVTRQKTSALTSEDTQALRGHLRCQVPVDNMG